MPDIVVAGHICLDIIPEIPASAGELDPGRLIEVGPATLSTGGAVSNVGIALHILQAGRTPSLVGKVGDDALGRVVAGLLDARSAGLSDGLIVGEGEATSYSVVINRPGRDRTFLHFPGANDTFCADDVPDAVLDGATHFHFGYPPIMRRFYEDGGAELSSLFERVAQKGLTTSLDLSLPDPTSDAGRADWPAILKCALPHVSFFMPSFDELAFMLGAGSAVPTVESLRELAKRCIELGARVVAIKCGGLGIYLRSGPIGNGGLGNGVDASEQWGGREIFMPTYEVPVAGTTGSGDATIAGFLCRLPRSGPEICLLLASLVGACCVQAPDALSGLSSLEEATKRSAAWPLRTFPFGMEASGWSNLGHAWRGPLDRT